MRFIVAQACLVFIILLRSARVAFALEQVPNEDARWESWKGLYKKSYNDKYEETYRRAIWVYNLKKIEENQRSKRSFTMKLNQLADLTVTEYRHLMLSRKYRDNKSQTCGSYPLSSNVNNLPDSVDWRTKGCVTSVKDQGEMGKSWAFSATGSLEGRHCIVGGQLVSLDTQKLAECCSECFSVDTAFAYMIAHNKLKNIVRSSEPKVENENCNFSAAAYGASLTGYVDIPKGSESQLQSATANVGPISVAIDASHQSFQLYQSGIYDEPACSSAQVDHAVLVVGYGTLNGVDYWLVKNSWGVNWGMKGYIMMSRNKENQCGIASDASYPTGVTTEPEKNLKYIEA